MSDLNAGDTVHVMIEGIVISTTQGSFVAVSFRDAYANEHTLWFSGMHKPERLISEAERVEDTAAVFDVPHT
jgi:hypothetical protein